MGILDSLFGGGTSSTKKKTKSNTTSMQTTEAPAYIKQASEKAVGMASDAASTPFQKYTGTVAAPLSDTQTGAIDRLKQLDSTQYGTVLDPFKGKTTQDYLNPYLSDMMSMVMGHIDEGTAKAYRDQGLRANAASAFGDARHGVMDTGIMREGLRAKREAGTDIGFKAFNEAMRLKADDIQRAMQGDRDALERVRAIFNAGGAEQQVAQKNADYAREEYWREQGYPMEQAKQLAAIAAATPYDKTTSGTTSGVTTEKTTTPTPSIASQVLGGAAMLGGAYLGGPGGAQLTSSLFGGGQGQMNSDGSVKI